ncbi:MAG: Fe-S cluster domain-containing protein [Candidatus Cryptobacteroides sp.]
MTNIIIWTIAVITLLGLVLAVSIFLVAKKFTVKEDPRIDQVEAVMPGANCGGCGFAGCRAFATACVGADNLDKTFCPVGGNETMKKVADILGMAVQEKAPMVAVVRCNGSCANRPETSSYDGAKSCRVKASLYAGDTACRYGCLGCGDCVKACAFGAIKMDSETGLPVVDQEKCTACGACAKACPKGVIEIRNKGPRDMRVYVSCINKDKGAVARKACKAACIGCGKCAKVCAHDAIVVENNVAYIDFTKCKLCRKCVLECPTGAIHDVNFPKPAVKPAPKPAAAPASAAVKPAAEAPTPAPKEATAQDKPVTKEEK